MASSTRSRSSSLVYRRSIVQERVREHGALQQRHVLGQLARIGQYDLRRLQRRCSVTAGDVRAETTDVELVRRDAAQALVVVHADEALQLGVKARFLVQLTQRVHRWRRADLRVSAR